MLRDKLNFIHRFYEAAGQPFTEAIRKIENHEEPYVAHGEPLNDEPPFLTEWQEAKESLNILGQSCLCLAQTSLKDFLVAFVERSGKNFPAKERGESWFDAFQRFFLKEYGIDWTKTGVDLGVLEQINLARNDIQHEGRPYDLARVQDKRHTQRFPNSIFASELDKAIFREFSTHQPCRIDLTPEGLAQGLEIIEQFCLRIEEHGKQAPA